MSRWTPAQTSFSPPSLPSTTTNTFDIIVHGQTRRPPPTPRQTKCGIRIDLWPTRRYAPSSDAALTGKLWAVSELLRRERLYISAILSAVSSPTTTILPASVRETSIVHRLRSPCLEYLLPIATPGIVQNPNSAKPAPVPPTKCTVPVPEQPTILAVAASGYQ
jgi:hypothetical protein